MAPKIRTYFLVAFLLFSLSLTYAIRPATPKETEHGDVDQGEQVQVEESCVGVEEDECLLRRSLAAHLDYVYTKKHNP